MVKKNLQILNTEEKNKHSLNWKPRCCSKHLSILLSKLLSAAAFLGWKLLAQTLPLERYSLLCIVWFWHWTLRNTTLMWWPAMLPSALISHLSIECHVCMKLGKTALLHVSICSALEAIKKCCVDTRAEVSFVKDDHHIPSPLTWSTISPPLSHEGDGVTRLAKTCSLSLEHEMEQAWPSHTCLYTQTFINTSPAPCQNLFGL